MNNYLNERDVIANFGSILSQEERSELLDKLGIPQTRLVWKLLVQLSGDRIAESLANGNLDFIDQALLDMENSEN